MASVTFEVTNYEVKIAREMNGVAGGLNLKFPAYIVCKGAQYTLYVYFLDDTSPIPANNTNLALKFGNVFVPRWMYDWYIDLVRNEKPLYSKIDDVTPKWNCLYTGTEPVGEAEI